MRRLMALAFVTLVTLALASTGRADDGDEGVAVARAAGRAG
jgi:hypothetical protein